MDAISQKIANSLADAIRYSKHLDAFEASFIKQTANAYLKWGAKTRVSEKQKPILEAIVNKIQIMKAMEGSDDEFEFDIDVTDVNAALQESYEEEFGVIDEN